MRADEYLPGALRYTALPREQLEFYVRYAALYRAEAQADLYEVYGVSLAVLIAERRLVELAELLGQLPQASRFWAALMDDEEYAEQIAEASQYADGDEPPSWAPAYRDYTALYQLVTQVHDAIGQVSYTVAAVQGAKPKKPKPFPRPVTAIERARSKADREMANGLLAKFGLGPMGQGPAIKPQVHLPEESEPPEGA